MTNQKSISSCGQRLLDDMRMRKLADSPQKNYVPVVEKLTPYLKRSPDTATAEDLRNLHPAAAAAYRSSWQSKSGSQTRPESRLVSR